MNRRTRILVVEDEEAIREGLLDVLVFHGYDVESAATGPQGLSKASTGKFDLVLLDIMLPGMDGYEVCNRIRAADRDQPVVMLTAKSSDEDIIEGLKLGADDYVAKPFSIQELLLRLEAVLRRCRVGQQRARMLVLGDVEIDTENLAGRNGTQTLAFTRREIELLAYLADNADRAVSREELLSKVWGYPRGSGIETRTIDIHIAKLRRKIETDHQQPRYLVTVRGAGYRLLTTP